MTDHGSGDGRLGGRDEAMLLFRVGSRVCALEGRSVSEIMRPLPIEPLPGLPAFVLGLAVVRGRPVPVVDARRLFGAPVAAPPRAFVALRAGERPAAVAVDEVLGVARGAGESLETLPSLLGDAERDVVQAIGTRDAELLLVLRAARLVPEEVWAALDARDAGEGREARA